MKADAEVKVENLNRLYRRRTKFYYNNIVDYNYSGKLHYGVVPTDIDHRDYSKEDYDKLLRAIESDAIKTNSFYVSKPLFNKHKCIYEADRWESFKRKKKHFINALYDDRYVVCEASIIEIVKELPVEELILWLKDNSIEISDVLNTIMKAKTKQTLLAMFSCEKNDMMS